MVPAKTAVALAYYERVKERITDDASNFIEDDASNFIDELLAY
jgi:hypothetical protein